MSNFISIAQAFAQWQELASSIHKQYGEDDVPAMNESWNDYTDGLAKDGQLCALQYHYCPAYDEPMPGTGSRWDALSDDREFILDAMNVTLEATFIPFSQSRNKAEKTPSLNWLVTLKKDGREVITTDYMQGCGHCPADKKTFNTPALNPATEKRDAIKYECETGREYSTKFFSNLNHRPGKPIAPPDVTDVLHSLLLDADALNCRDFADWCGDFGYDTDSIKARETYDACIATATKLRAAFGQKTVDDLRELFEGM